MGIKPGDVLREDFTVDAPTYMCDERRLST
jgi:hypothetical protein